MQSTGDGTGKMSGQLSAICQRVLDAELQTGLAEGRDYNINLQVLLASISTACIVEQVVQGALDQNLGHSSGVPPREATLPCI